MPIRPQYKWLYPVDWPQLSAMIRFTRAKGKDAWQPAPRERKVSTALQAYATMTTSAALYYAM